MPQRKPSFDVRHELLQTQPYQSITQESFLSLVRTSSVVSRRIARVVEPYGLSVQQYNVLRILRGAGADGLPTLAIRDRMIEEGTTITRLIDKLEKAGHVERQRSSPDRRQVLCSITDRGLKLLTQLEPPIVAAQDTVMSTLTHEQQHQLIALLGILRVNAPLEDC